MNFETHYSIVKQPFSQTKTSIDGKAFIASLLEMIIAVKDHKTMSSFKTQLQRETLASGSLTPTRVITLQLTQITRQKQTHIIMNMSFVNFLINKTFEIASD